MSRPASSSASTTTGGGVGGTRLRGVRDPPPTYRRARPSSSTTAAGASAASSASTASATAATITTPTTTTTTTTSTATGGAGRAGGRARTGTTCPNPSCPDPKVEEVDDKLLCVTCSTLVSDSTIVSEVQFGETATGAAILQGSFVGADQSHARTFGGGGGAGGGGGGAGGGGAFRRVEGSNSREIRDAHGKRYINQLAAALRIPPATADMAFQIYKLAVYHNFIQGRRTKSVAAVALYIACRKQKRNSVLLIDFSDVLNVNVFKLGQIFKDFLKECEIKGVEPMLPENLVYRFATKLEFGRMTERVAQDAARLVQRMDRDWMTTGRRPAGICGACLILAARMNNFRRTVREVVYVVKVADFTIHKRLEEFRETDSSNLTVEQFRIMELEKRHDPPAFTEQRNGKRRRRGARLLPDAEATAEAEAEAATATAAAAAAAAAESGQEEGSQDNGGHTGRRVRPGVDEDGQPNAVAPTAAAAAVTAAAAAARPATTGPRRDRDGFVIPDIPIDPTLLAASASALSELGSSNVSRRPANEGQGGREARHEDGDNAASSSPSASGARLRTATPTPAARKNPRKRPAPPEPSSADLAVEEELESEISQLLNDPSTQEAFTSAQAEAAAPAPGGGSSSSSSNANEGTTRASSTSRPPSAASTAAATSPPPPPPPPPPPLQPPPTTTATAGAATTAAAAAAAAPTSVPVRMTEDISDSEFADDPEVASCLLSPAEQELKERIWVHENRDYLREQQRRLLRRQLEERNGTAKKPVRRRRRKGRIGEGGGDGNGDGGPGNGDGGGNGAGTGAAGGRGAAEATVDMLRRRGFSKKINYDVVERMFDGASRRRASREGSVAASEASVSAASLSSAMTGGSGGGGRGSGRSGRGGGGRHDDDGDDSYGGRGAGYDDNDDGGGDDDDTMMGGMDNGGPVEEAEAEELEEEGQEEEEEELEELEDALVGDAIDDAVEESVQAAAAYR